MQTLVAFFRHPLEIMMNTVYLLLIGKLVFGASIEAIALALAIEGCLETFHHANIRISKKFYWIGYIIQLPHMHLVHHEYGLHKYNYSPFCWDAIFGTVAISHKWNKRLGFADSNNIKKYFLLKNH